MGVATAAKSAEVTDVVGAAQSQGNDVVNG